jgi:hypothetical protein
MKNIQTPIKSNIGNQDKSTPSNDGILSSDGVAVIPTPLLDNFSTKLGSFGA